MTRRIWLRHLFLGVPLAAFLHTVLQFAHAYSPNVDNDWGFFPVHWVAGILFGAPLLVPAFTIQAYIGLWLRLFGRVVQILAGGFTQSALVGLWVRFVGLEPSLPGNFSTLPMTIAGFVAGSAVAALAAPRAIDPEQPQRPTADSDQSIFNYRSLRAFMILAACICFGGGLALMFLLREQSPDPILAFGLPAAGGLFWLWGAYLMEAEIGISENAISWSRGLVSTTIQWVDVTEIRSTADKLKIRSRDSKITVDKQLGDYGSFYRLLRRYAPPFAWKTLSLPLQCRASLVIPGFLCGAGMAWIAFMWWIVDYGPPKDTVDLVIVIFFFGLGGIPLPIGLYMATFRYRFDICEIRVSSLFRRKVYEVRNLVDLRLSSASMPEVVLRQPGVIMAPLTDQQFEFHFRDGTTWKLFARRLTVDPEALYHLLRNNYLGDDESAGTKS